MRAVRCALVVATVCGICASASAVPRGVMTALRGKYEGLDAAGAQFACINGDGSVPAIQVNDDYCDCADGSDEPGTGACSYLADRYPTEFRFECRNEGFQPETFFHSRVNDGICDCCDGSDEFVPVDQGGVQCPNVCAEANAKAEQLKTERERVRQAGLAAKATLIAEAASSQAGLKQKLTEHAATLASVDAEIKAAEEEKAKWEAVEKEEREEVHRKSLAEKEKWEAEQAEKKKKLEEEKAAAAAEEKPSEEAPATTGEKRLSENQASTPPNVMCTKWRQTGDCKGNGPRIPDADKECDTVIESGASGFCECVDMRTGLDVEYPFDCEHRQLTCQKVCEAEGGEAGFLNEEQIREAAGGVPRQPEEETFTIDTGASHFKSEANEARSKFQSATARKEEAERGKKDIEEQLSGDLYGPEHVFLPLKGKCFDRNEGHYTYTICPFDQVKQGHTNMGRFKSWGEQTYGAWGGKHDFGKMIFEDGERCWNGPARSTEVRMVCGATNEVLSVDEPSMCTYKMVFQTPSICE